MSASIASSPRAFTSVMSYGPTRMGSLTSRPPAAALVGIIASLSTAMDGMGLLNFERRASCHSASLCKPPGQVACILEHVATGDRIPRGLGWNRQHPRHVAGQLVGAGEVRRYAHDQLLVPVVMQDRDLLRGLVDVAPVATRDHAAGVDPGGAEQEEQKTRRPPLAFALASLPPSPGGTGRLFPETQGPVPGLAPGAES